MNSLIEQKKAVSRVNYSTGGRPSIEYTLVNPYYMREEKTDL